MTASAPSSADHAFLDDLDKKLWNAADRLRSNLDAAVYKHAVLGLIFLKYVSDAFDLRREELEASFRDPKSDYFLDRADYKTDAAHAKAIHDELEDRDYFTEKNVFWVPPLARWKTIRENAALAPDTEIEIRNGKIEKYTFRSAARLIDDALEAVEKENPRPKGFIEKNRYMQLQLEPAKLVGLSAIPIAINQGFIAMKCGERAFPEFVLNWCQSTMAEIKSRATGTTFPEISKKNFRPISMLLPPAGLMTAFTAATRPLYNQITANLRQSCTLATLRDTLLPKLLSGELKLDNFQN